MCHGLAIEHVGTSPCYPKTSHAERVTKNIGVALRIFHPQNNIAWDTNLHFFQVTLNAAKHDIMGTSSSEPLLG